MPMIGGRYFSNPANGRFLMQGAQEEQQPVGPKHWPGMLMPGNISLWNRPLVRNEDGTPSTEYSTSFQEERPDHPFFGKEVLAPSIVNGKFLTPDGKKPPEGSDEEKAMFQRARQHYIQSGEHMGIFDTPENSDQYANWVHEQQNQRVNSGGNQ